MATTIQLLFCAIAGALVWFEGIELFVAWYSEVEPPLTPAWIWAAVARSGPLLLAMLTTLASLLVRRTW